MSNDYPGLSNAAIRNAGYCPRCGLQEKQRFPHIHLQSWGIAPAIPASDLRQGDVLRYNFGTVSTIVDVPQVRGKTVYYITRMGDRDDQSGENRYQNHARLTSLIPVTNSTYREHHPEYSADIKRE